jgi:hypothetical protein
MDGGRLGAGFRNCFINHIIFSTKKSGAVFRLTIPEYAKLERNQRSVLPQSKTDCPCSTSSEASVWVEAEWPEPHILVL